ncbi:PREDICTED: uncharacterized protein LOC105557430 [Vollenhovia emeryi]|uniref:uncharacterized protein LOC105557430 n=1 Tax=Vollenhovia emeryi TaxID=411798 RepID=UPI0005F48B35|nr:PREDICTED: uncharacterized protein LOC105557430 [Vollenhovia emeryi]
MQVPSRADIRLPIEATVLFRISLPLPNGGIGNRHWEHLDGLPLADPKYYFPRSIDVLLGAEVFVSILRDGCRKGGGGEPDVFNTIFGWVLMGAVSPHSPRVSHSFMTTLDSIDDAVGRFWRLEEIPDSPSGSKEDIRCEELFKQTTRRESSGRFVVSYPFSRDPPCFVDSRSIALNRFRSLERRFKADVTFKTDYCNFMQDYLDSGHMELIERPYPVDGPIYYLPHHGVTKLESSTMKLRVVFDASSKCTIGISLNQTLLCGPKLQQDLMAILIRFRIGSMALTADVKQMFRQVWIEPGQRDYQRLTVTFGIAPSPYFTIRCLLQLAEEGRIGYPLASDALMSSLYVDDIVTSVQSVEEARDLWSQLQLLLRRGRFLQILGLHWCSESDSFGFRVNPLAQDCSKRTILLELARIFDPLGFLTPVTFTAKRLIQQLWILKLDWDLRPPLEVCQRWERYRSELAVLTSLRMPCSLSCSNVIRRELHGFCDASEQGYGTVVYLRIVSFDGITIQLIGSKSKVAPLKSVTMPRLELCAALLLSELLAYRSDSTITLSWIRSPPHRWKTFVRNRIARVQENVPISAWGHVDIHSNPVDYCSRGLYPKELLNCTIWWHGPEWLVDFEPRSEPVLESGVLGEEEEAHSWTFTENISESHIHHNNIMVSLDVTALFTNVPKELVLKGIKNRWHEISKATTLSLPQFSHAIDLTLNSTSFSFNNQIYEQIFGSPMRSPLFPILADIVMDDLETHSINSLDFEIQGEQQNDNELA